MDEEERRDASQDAAICAEGQISLYVFFHGLFV